MLEFAGPRELPCDPDWLPMSGLDDSSPDFLRLLDTDPAAAMEGFYKFAVRMFQVAPPRIYHRVHADHREDVFAEVIKHCIQDGFRVLRRYQPRPGATFAGFLAIVASHKISDLLEHDANIRKREVHNPSDDYANEERDNRPSVEPNPEELALRAERHSVLSKLVRELNDRCRLLFRLRSRGFSNQEIARLLGLPQDKSKMIGTQFHACREKFIEMLRENGYEISDFVTVG